MGELTGKVAFITGAARGQGRAHAVKLASEGADIIAVDLCAQIDSVPYPLATPDDLAATVKLVEKTGARIVASQADVRDRDAVKTALREGPEKLGNRLDIVVANAGIAPMAAADAWQDVIDVNLTGVWNTAQAAIPYLVAGGRGGAMILIGSTAGLRGSGAGPYTASKHGVVGIMRGLANELAEDDIRVNVVHPTAVNTMMAVNEGMQEYLASQVANGIHSRNALDVELLEPSDISNTVAFLLSDEARYITGSNIPVDAGFVNRVD